ncbi:hypothetical protein [Desertibacillus haloalkaliphilus]|uniref:hypothetical protein n=1 Tax=Desertibacillus haloalkaliphilus TaxID=1328930 RepID=UPI001C26DD93|nr:hypothetical protein [Desertibacillus haloalkaliphilus]MBU8905909.1 hypothetical protein [Desertibacillus haloalkaliphilus]
MAKQQVESNVCKSCDSEEVSTMQLWQYFFFVSTLPVIVTVTIAVLVEPIFFFLLFIILLINYRVAKKKTPFTMCRSCKQVTQGGA